MPTTEQRLKRALLAYERRRDHAKRLINRLAFFRFVIFIGLVLSVAGGFGGPLQLYAFIAFPLLAAIFIFLMVRHDRTYQAQQAAELRLDAVRADLARVTYRFDQIPEHRPIAFPENHPFAHDLDLESPVSLLKLVDNSYHLETKEILRSWLEAVPDLDDLAEREEAVRELAMKRRFRRKLGTVIAEAGDPELNPRDFQPWLEMAAPPTIGIVPYFLGRLAALFTTTVMVSEFFFGYTILPWLPVLLAQITLVYTLDYFQKGYYFAFMSKGKTLRAAAVIVAEFEKLNPQSARLKTMQQSRQEQGGSVGEGLRELSRMHDMLLYRANGFAHFVMNVFLLWDQHYLRKLDKKRAAFGKGLEPSIRLVFELEALAAPANFHDLFPEYPFAEWVPGRDVQIRAQNIAHPTIPGDRRIGNDYQLGGQAKLHLITGSNMSGKSTFLRTLGTNILLARLAAPVCARSLQLTPFALWTSIKIQDSLAAGVSYFYAEVRRLKQIIDAVEEDDRPVFYLLDEILKGTNSRERLIACKALILFLIRGNAAGLITTHDLELLALQQENPEAITNYHFQEGVRDGELNFDYKLKDGELTSTNAIRLMKMAGVPLDFEAAGNIQSDPSRYTG